MRLQADSIWGLITFILECFAFVLVGAEFFDTYNRVQEPGWGALIALAVALTLLITAIRFLFMGGWFLLGPKLSPDKFTDRRGQARSSLLSRCLACVDPSRCLRRSRFLLPRIPERDSRPGFDSLRDICGRDRLAAVQLPRLANNSAPEVDVANGSRVPACSSARVRPCRAASI